MATVSGQLGVAGRARRFAENPKTIEQRYLRLAQRDFDRARQLYEPILGFSNVERSIARSG